MTQPTISQQGTEQDPAPATLVVPPSSCYSDPEKRFTIIPSLGINMAEFLRMDSYSAAMAFVAGQVLVQGNLVAAVRFFMSGRHSAVATVWHSLGARLGHGRVASALRGANSARDIQFHYDQSNAFYARFLDPWMQYSAADFSNPRRSLEKAQEEKLEQICRALRLQPGERFLDIGCGWGGLVVYAAERFGVEAVGCTLSPAQREFGVDFIKRKRLESRVSIELRDYREIEGRFAKIASVGMFEHVGRRHLPEYFKRMHELLAGGGLFLNRGIVRPEGASDGPETLFLQKNVFPGGELEHLADIVRAAGNAGFEIQKMDDFRLDYARTCEAWVARLQQNAEACRALVGDATFRTWLLYLAASSVSFEDGSTDAVQVLLSKSDGRHRVKKVDEPARTSKESTVNVAQCKR